MPRVVADQREKFENDELFRKLVRESEVLIPSINRSNIYKCVCMCVSMYYRQPTSQEQGNKLRNKFIHGLVDFD